MACPWMTLVGYMLLGTYLIMWQAASLSVQALQGQVPVFQLGIYRLIAMCLICGIWIFIRRLQIRLTTDCYIYVIVMSVANTSFNLLFYAGATLIPLGHASALYVCTRMFALTALLKVFSDLSVDRMMVLGILGSCCGMLLVSQPWKGFTEGFHPGFLDQIELVNTSSAATVADSSLDYGNISNVTSTDNSGIVLLGYLLVILSGVVGAVYLLAVSIFLRSVNSAVLCFLNAGLCLPISLLTSLYFEEAVLVSDVNGILLTTLHCVSYGVGAVLECVTYQILNPIRVSIAENLETVVSVVSQYTLMSKYLYGRANSLEIIGCVIICVFSSLNSVTTHNYNHEDLKG